MTIRYPLALYRAGWDDLADFVTVHGEQEEADARREGYRMLSDAAPVPPVLAVEADDDDGGEDDTPEAPRRRGRPRKAA